MGEGAIRLDGMGRERYISDVNGSLGSLTRYVSAPRVARRDRRIKTNNSTLDISKTRLGGS